MALTTANRKRLWALAGGRCAICRDPLIEAATDVDPAVVIGMEAHIVSTKPDGPRYRPLEPEEVDDPENLILLCPTDHAVVDKQESHYSEDQLRQIKSAHELWVRTALEPNDRAALFSSDQDGALLVEVVQELPHRLDLGLLLLEVRVAVLNQTADPKGADFLYSYGAGQHLTASAEAIRQSIEAVRLQSPPLAPHTMIQRGERVAGWLAMYIPNPPLGIPAYDVAAIDESGTTYKVRVPKH